MRLSLSIKKDAFISIGLMLIVLSAFNFYFFDTFYFHFLWIIIVSIGFIIILLTIIPNKISWGTILLIMYLLYYTYSGFISNFFNQEFGSIIFTGTAFILFSIYLDSLENKRLIIKVLDWIINLFVLLTTISFIVFILFTLKVPIPHEIANLNGRGFLYTNYMNLLIICNYVNVDIGHFIISRFNGMFIEPSMLGIYTGLLLMIDYIIFPNKKFRKGILIFLSFFSFSFSYFIFLFLLIIYRLSFKHILIILILLAGIFFVVNSLIPQESQKYLSALTIDRFKVKNGQLAGNTRNTDEIKFKYYLEHTSSKYLLFGNGKGSNQLKEASYSSWCSVLYESGIIGFILFLLLHIYYLIYLPIKAGKIKIIIIGIYPVALIYPGLEVISFFTIMCFAAIKFYSEEYFNNVTTNIIL